MRSGEGRPPRGGGTIRDRVGCGRRLGRLSGLAHGEGSFVSRLGEPPVDAASSSPAFTGAAPMERAHPSAERGSGRRITCRQALNPIQGPVHEEAVVGDGAKHVPISRFQGFAAGLIGLEADHGYGVGRQIG